MTDAALSPPAPPSQLRWLVLLACSLAMFGNYYVFDALYPVTPLLEKAFGYTGEQIGLLDTSYNVAALLTLIAGGVLIDRIGMAASSVLFGAIGAIGSVCIAVLPALFPGAPWAGMMVGRFLLGIGAELFIVAATTVVGRWFKGKQISFALAIQLFVARAGSWVADLSPDLFKDWFHSWQPPLVIAAALGVSWFLFALIYAALERTAARRYAVQHAAATDKLVLGDLVRYDLAYWWVVGMCVAFYATIFPFRSFANLYLIDAHGMEPGAAGQLKSMLPLFSMFGMPVFGLVADRMGKRSLLMLVGSLLLVLPFLLLLYTDLPPALSIGTMGVAFALVPAVLWPAVTYLVPERRLGSAYALMTFCQQLFWAAMSPAVGKVRDAAGWTPVMGMLAGLAAVGLIFSILLWRSERGPNAHGLERAKV
ncbi:MAG TPA: MFS transporter [Candidatus Polarisedimenticolaceae bacterium]|nr:MFS transporter [Candidatus Polarisedimenticolaceae bacterium]